MVFFFSSSSWGGHLKLKVMFSPLVVVVSVAHLLDRIMKTCGNFKATRRYTTLPHLTWRYERARFSSTSMLLLGWTLEGGGGHVVN